MVAVFLASLGQMGGNAHIAGRVLRGMADSAPGRAALRQGAARWRDRAAGAATEGQAGTVWAASTLLSAGTALRIICSAVYITTAFQAKQHYKPITCCDDHQTRLLGNPNQLSVNTAVITCAHMLGAQVCQPIRIFDTSADAEC